ncbi:hypothetical protein [Acinetobacter phage vB_AbaP_HB01]|nr:hypothetical protein [Acinetobacter phage vB_AbaP_HB01]
MYIALIFIAFAVAMIYLWKSKYKGLLLIPIISTMLFMAVQGFTYLGAKESQGGDVMVLNGHIVKKYSQRVSCSHSYSCNCRIVQSGKTSSTVCDTCYEHSYDVDWVIKSNVGSTEINRVNRQGTIEPPRFTQAYVGEPFSIELGYYNYIKASPLSVFKDYDTFRKVEVPSYPKVYDYYKIRHVVDYKSEWRGQFQVIDNYLAHKLKYSSAKAKANVVVIFYGGGDIREAMRVKNYGGRINDLTVMVDAAKDGTIRNAYVFSWSKNDLVNVKLRDEILDMKNMNGSQKKIVDSIDNILVNYYSHRSMEEFKYLEHNIEMPMWYYVVTIFGTLVILGLNVYIVREI